MNAEYRISSPRVFVITALIMMLSSMHQCVDAFLSPTTQRAAQLHPYPYKYTARFNAKADENSQNDKNDKDNNNNKDNNSNSNSKNKQNPKSKKNGGNQSPKIPSPKKKGGNIFSLLDPFKAGAKLRQTIDSAFGPGLSPEKRSVYYLDERFRESSSLSQGALAFAASNPLFDQVGDTGDDYIPEVLVIGATGAIGRLVVRRLVLSGRFRVRVLVRDLYSNTLNLLGTGVTYCQGDLGNPESLEYAVTDVDKIVFCAGPPRKDEDDFGNKFIDFVKENLIDDGREDENGENQNEIDFQKLSDTMELRAKLAQQVDDMGMQNVVRAYQNVRYADYGTSQAAKRSLFKFQDREEDFGLFTINDDEDFGGASVDIDTAYDYDDEYAQDQTRSEAKNRPSTFNSQVTWMKNQFKHGVFVGRLPIALNGVGSEASIISSRLRSRDDPEKGTDLSNGFAGFVCRICSDGKTYEAFIRTSEYETSGIEYVCKFQTETKTSKDGNKSLNKFQTIRLPFSNFEPVERRTISDAASSNTLNDKTFQGKDVKQIGFRVNSADNVLADSDPNKKRYKWMNFYISLCYIKVYRSQPEPEFVYLSDARIPPALKNGMVRHDIKRILSRGDEEDESVIFNEEEAKRVLQNPKDRSGEELYYKYRGEEILKNSGLQYSIIRVPSLNELPSGEFSTIQLKQVSFHSLLQTVFMLAMPDYIIANLLSSSAVKCRLDGSFKGGSSRSLC